MFKKMLFLLLAFTIPVLVLGQTTGKISGVVTDKNTGEPLPGVNITIEETYLGAATDIDGYYIILNVPVGDHNVKLTYVGYKDVIVQNVHVSADLTTTLNQQLEAGALELEEAITVTAERPLVEPSATNTNIITSAEEIQQMPFRDLESVASLTAGVLKRDNERVMNIRGGRDAESVIYIDGVLINDPYNNAVRVDLPTTAIEEMSVQTGGFNAEYGESMSGIIVTTTKSGTQNYSAAFDVLTDEFLSSSDKDFGLGTYSYGYNEYNGSVSGPIIPGTKHTFFLSAMRKWQKDWTPSWGYAENNDKPAGLEGGTLPGNHNSVWSYTGKLNFHIIKSILFKGSAAWTDKTFTQFSPLYFFDTDHAPVYDTEHRSFNATLTHTLNPKTYYDLKFNYYNTYREIYDPFYGDDLFKYGNPNYNPYDANNQENWGTIYFDRYSQLEPDYFDPGRQYDDYFKNKTEYYGIDFDITHQLEQHTLKAGFEYKYHTLREYRVIQPVKLALRDAPGRNLSELELYQGADVRFYGYDVNGNEVNDGSFFDTQRDASGDPIGSGWKKQEPYHPILMNAYIQDKIEFRDLIINLGLRYDRIDPNAWQFKDIEAEVDDEGNVIGGGAFGGNQEFDKSDIEDSEVHDFLSPRLGLSFPVAENTVFHAQYGIFYQPPLLQDLYLSPFYLDRFVNAGGYFTTLDNPNLKPPKTTSFEIGFRQALGNIAAIRLTAFYKETEDLTQVIPVQTDVTQIAFSNNGDFGVIKGLDLIFNLRRTMGFATRINYELQYANGTGSSTGSNFNIAWQNGSAGNYPKTIQALDFEQRHTGSVNINYQVENGQGPAVMGIKPLENLGVNLLFTFNSGRRFTGLEILNQLPFSGRDEDYPSEIPRTPVNGEHMPWNYRFDLSIDRSFNLNFGNFTSKFTVYMDILNLFNTETVMYVWSSTGLPDATGYLETAAGQSYYNGLTADQQKQYKLRETNYSHYGIPRQIRLGLRYIF